MEVYTLDNVSAAGQLSMLLNKHSLTYRAVGQFAERQSNLAKRLYGRLEEWKIRRLGPGCSAAVVLWNFGEG